MLILNLLIDHKRIPKKKIHRKKGNKWQWKAEWKWREKMQWKCASFKWKLKIPSEWKKKYHNLLAWITRYNSHIKPEMVIVRWLFADEKNDGRNFNFVFFYCFWAMCATFFYHWILTHRDENRDDVKGEKKNARKNDIIRKKGGVCWGCLGNTFPPIIHRVCVWEENKSSTTLLTSFRKYAQTMNQQLLRDTDTFSHQQNKKKRCTPNDLMPTYVK